MMLVFFFGIGMSAIATALAQSPLQMAVGLFAIGVFGAIYHPVGIPLVIQGYTKTGLRIAVNGVFGNLGVAVAALLTGYLVDQSGWRSAFIWPGLVTIVIGAGYAILVGRGRSEGASTDAGGASPENATAGGMQLGRHLLIRVFAIVFFSTAIGSLVFQSTTFSLPKIFDERLGDLAVSATLVGWYAFVVFAIASMGQLVVGYLLDRFSIKAIFVGVAIFQVVFFRDLLELDFLIRMADSDARTHLEGCPGRQAITGR